jgi:hypothetical protein
MGELSRAALEAYGTDTPTAEVGIHAIGHQVDYLPHGSDRGVISWTFITTLL